MPNLPKIDVYNFRYKICVRNVLNEACLFSHRCINKLLPKLEHKYTDYIVSSAHIRIMPFILPTLVNSK